MQEPKIEVIPQKKLIGHAIDMSLMDNKTFELFSGFMPHKHQIVHSVSQDIYEVMLYNEVHFKRFSPNNTFTKWASLEVSEVETIPEGMSTLLIEAGLYAVFQYKGLPQGFGMLMRTILTEWLPQSKYHLDHRPHFNVLDECYKRNDPNSEEAVYIPIKETT